jgi:phenylacetate-CoA ligase
MLGGQPVTPGSRSRPPFWVWNIALRQLYLSSYHLRPENIRFYVEALRRYRVRYLLGYASALSALSHLALEAGLKPEPVAVAISNAEPLFESQRQIVTQAFGCPVRSTYGMAEIVAAASECRFGVLHEWPEVGITEVLRDDLRQPAQKGTTGRLICSGLFNLDMPLIRYDTGDRGTSTASAECVCGRRLPAFGSIEGRSDDVICTPDGRRVGRLDPVFKTDLGIREAQIVQDRVDLVNVYIVPTSGFNARQARVVVEGLRDRLGPEVEIQLHEVAEIERTSQGKFRAVVSRISPARPDVRA